MITLHHLENSRSFRILWLLEELGLQFELKDYKREIETDLAEEAFKKLHPLGRAPLLIDGERVLVESGAIIEYLVDTYDGETLRPAQGTEGRIRYNYWMHAAEGSVMNFMTVALILSRMETRVPALIRPVIKMVTTKVRANYLMPNLKKILDYIESSLANESWFAGDVFSAADIQMIYAMFALNARGGLSESYPNCKRWMDRVSQRPAYKLAIEKGGALKMLES